jgi:molybdopterin-biosynthesis enzyme MoeA-like protein
MNDTSAVPAIVTAGLLVIGDEILSGRTKDRNIGYIADYLTAIGIDLREVRVVADDEAAIVEALNALRGRHTYVFTTGGIGPTMTTSRPIASPRRSAPRSTTIRAPSPS